MPRNEETAKMIDIRSLLEREGDEKPGACLVMIAGEDLGRRFPLEEGTLTIGRDTECDIDLQDTTLSRQHCEIVASAQGAMLRDLQSTNHTYLNGCEVTEHPLTSGDHIRVGATHFKYFRGDQAEQTYFEELYRLMTCDALTGALNRRAFDKELERHFSLYRRHNSPLSLIMMDIDHFKKLNDTYGHLAGDRVLAELGGLVREHKRTDDYFCRYGGEEFALLCPQTDLNGALRIAGRLRQQILEHIFDFEDKRLKVTLSFGVAELTDAAEDRNQFIMQADARLYMAKDEGRNRIMPQAG